MNKIQLGSIDFRKIYMMGGKYHIESDLYHDDDTVYKIFKYSQEEGRIERKERKIELLHDGTSLPLVVNPKDKICNDDVFFGYTMEYIKNAITLYDFNKASNNINLYFQILSTISKSLEAIHQDPRNIMLGDLNFNNIIIDNNFNPYIVDIDSCKIDGLTNDTTPAMIATYLRNRGFKKLTIDATPNTDKFSLMICALYVIFRKHIDKISMYEFDEKSEHIQTLKNMREYISRTKKYPTIPEVPYLHELIPDSSTPKVTVRTKKRI